MGRKLDALLGRRVFKASKFKGLVNLGISRLAVLKNQRQVRSSNARSDVVQLLNLGHQDRALLRVEVVIKEQNMLDVLVIIEGYFNLLLERLYLIENNKECPNELEEAISSLIFAASRCGEFPELQEIREVFTSQYGRDFAARAFELRNNCGVNPKIVQKLSTRQPILEIKMKVLKEIASENGITLQLDEETSPVIKKDSSGSIDNQNKPEPKSSDELENTNKNDQYSAGSQRAKKYRDVASAAQAAFESAAYAAAAARAAVELSRSESHDKGFDDDDDWASPQNHGRNSRSKDFHPLRSKLESDSEKIQPIDNYSSESEYEELPQNHEKFQAEHEYPKGSKNTTELQRSMTNSSMDLDANPLDQRKPLEEIITFDESDDETKNEFPKTTQRETFSSSKEEVRVERLNLERKPISMRTRGGYRR